MDDFHDLLEKFFRARNAVNSGAVWDGIKTVIPVNDDEVLGYVQGFLEAFENWLRKEGHIP